MRNVVLVLALMMSAPALWFSTWGSPGKAPIDTFGREEHGIYTFEPLSEDLELLGYCGGKTILSLSHITPAPDESLWYSEGRDILKGVGPNATLVDGAQWRLEDLAKEKEGGRFDGMPTEIQQTLLYQRERSASGESQVNGKAHRRYIFKDGRAISGSGFTISIPEPSSTGTRRYLTRPDISLEVLRKGVRIPLSEESFVPYDDRGQENPSDAVTVRWHVNLKLVADKAPH